MAQSLSQIYTHIVFHINLLDKVIIPEELQPRLHAYLNGICGNSDSPSLIVGGTFDHIHILCRMSKNIAASSLIKDLKVNSSIWMKSQADDFGMELSRFSWQKGYGVFSVSPSQLEKVKSYIANQEAHHRETTFRDEYLTLLRKHGVSLDEKYLWSS